MSTQNNPDLQDQQFHENLLKLKGQSVPDALSGESRSRCFDALEQPETSHRIIAIQKYRKPALLSTLGVAASIAIAVGFFYPTGNGSTVDAAIIVDKLAEQIEGDELIEITLDSLAIDEVSIDGYLQITNNAIAGDLEIKVEERKGQFIEVNASLALSDEGGWVLIRKLVIPDPQVQMFLNMFLPAGSDTLLILPTDEIKDAIGSDLGDGIAEVRGAASGEVVKVLKHLIDAQDEVGATVHKNRDGTYTLTLPIEDTETLENLIRVAANALGEQIDDDDIDLDDDFELLGCTFSVTYDPEEEIVRSFAITDFGDLKGSITVTLDGGEIDQDLLDSDRVTTPNTRILDLGALISSVESMGSMLENMDHSPHQKKSHRHRD